MVPGPRHGEDNREITVTLNGTEIDLFDGSVAELDFEPPGKEGKWAQKFADSQNEIAEQFWDWFYSEEKVLERIVACANPRDNLTENEMKKNLRKMYFFHGFIVWYDAHGFFAQDADYIENEYYELPRELCMELADLSYDEMVGFVASKGKKVPVDQDRMVGVVDAWIPDSLKNIMDRPKWESDLRGHLRELSGYI